MRLGARFESGPSALVLWVDLGRVAVAQRQFSGRRLASVGLCRALVSEPEVLKMVASA